MENVGRHNYITAQIAEIVVHRKVLGVRWKCFEAIGFAQYANITTLLLIINVGTAVEQLKGEPIYRKNPLK